MHLDDPISRGQMIYQIIVKRYLENRTCYYQVGMVSVFLSDCVIPTAQSRYLSVGGERKKEGS